VWLRSPCAWSLTDQSAIATRLERSTRYLLLVALPRGDHQADAVADALGAAITRLPKQLAKSLTWDLGDEMTQHARLNFRELIQDDVDTIATELNDRPRQTLAFQTPSEALAEVLR